MGQSAPTDQISLLLAGYVLGTLDAAEAEMFAQMVIEDPALIEQVDQMQQALESAYDMPELAPPPQLKEKVLAAVVLNSEQLTNRESTPAEPIGIAPAFEQRSSIQTSAIRTARALKAIAIALLAALGLSTFFNYMLWRSLKQQVVITPILPPQEQTTRSLTFQLSSTESSQIGTAEVSVNPDTLTAKLNTSQLPSIADDEVYVLWTVLKPEAPFTTDAKSAILTTTFEVDEQGSTRETLAVPAVFQQPELIAALGITVEPAESPQSHTGAPVLLSPI